MSVIMPTYKRLPVAFVRGRGATLWDARGRAYLDGLSGIAVTNLGHCHPRVTQAVVEQATELAHTSNLFRIPGQEQLGAELTSATGMDAVFFCNSGTEANEAAIKLARRHGHNRGLGQPTIVVLEGAFHGRSLGALAATAGEKMKTPFAPLPTGFLRVPRDDLQAVHDLTSNRDIVAVLVEPVQGEGGVRLLDPDYLQGLRTLCDDQGWLLMFDEVQSGNGRCGALYAFQRLQIAPDVLITAKGLGNGYPIGACMARGAASRALSAGDHGTTFGGSPLACAAGSAVINTLADSALLSSADVLREQLLSSFRAHLVDAASVAEVRGLGLMIGIEVTVPTENLVTAALELGVVINLTAGNTLRLLPPLVMSAAEAEQLGKAVAEAVNRASEETP